MAECRTEAAGAEEYIESVVMLMSSWGWGLICMYVASKTVVVFDDWDGSELCRMKRPNE